jgi:hypothetical protein
MKPDAYRVIIHAVEQGVNYGYRRAYKHDDNPSEEVVIDCIEDEVINQICEWFSFDE